MLFGKKRPSEPSPSWVKWLLIGFVLMVVAGNFNKNAPVHDTVQQAVSNLSPQKLLPIEDYKTKIFPGYGTTLRITEDEPGKGASAICGQQAGIIYSAFLDNGTPVEDKIPLSFRIGEGKAPAAFEQGVIGMKPGGRRSLWVPPAMASGLKDVPPDSPAKLEITLQEATPALPDFSAMPYRVVTVRNGADAAIACGKPAKIHAVLWSLDGKKLFSSYEGDEKPLAFTPGKSELFLGLEQGVLGMRRGGIRLLVIPPTLQKTLDGNAPAIELPLPKNQTILVDVEAMQ